MSKRCSDIVSEGMSLRCSAVIHRDVLYPQRRSNAPGLLYSGSTLQALRCRSMTLLLK